MKHSKWYYLNAIFLLAVNLGVIFTTGVFIHRQSVIVVIAWLISLILYIWLGLKLLFRDD